MPSFHPASLTALTFDCYGTLIDWERGAIDALRPLLARHGAAPSDDEIIALFQELETEPCQPPYTSYKTVLASVVEGVGAHFGFTVDAADKDLLAKSIPSWRPFPDTVAALQALGRRYQLSIISNIDDDLFAATLPQLGVTFAHIVTAEQARCYKPGLPIFVEALRRLAAPQGTVAHIAEGAAEVGPARQLGCSTVWVRRNGRSASLLTERPDLEVPDLQSLLVQMAAAG